MSCDDVNTKGRQGPWGLVVAVVGLFFGLCLAVGFFVPPATSHHGFTSDAVPTINDSGDVDCGGSSLSVVLRGPRVAIPPGDLARRAEQACRHDAVEYVVSSVIGLVLVTAAGSRLVSRVRRSWARLRAKERGDSGDGMVPDRLLEDGTLVRPD